MVRIERTIKLRKTARLRTGCLWVVEVTVRPLHPQASVSPATCSIMQHELRLARLIGLASMSFAAKVAALRSFMVLCASLFGAKKRDHMLGALVSLGV